MTFVSVIILHNIKRFYRIYAHFNNNPAKFEVMLLKMVAQKQKYKIIKKISIVLSGNLWYKCINNLSTAANTKREICRTDLHKSPMRQKVMKRSLEVSGKQQETQSREEYVDDSAGL